VGLANAAETHASTASAAATSVNARLDNVSAAGTAGLQSVVNALSNAISAAGGGGSVNAIGRVSVGQSISTSALTNISGLCVSVSAGGVYKLEGFILYTKNPLATVGFFGFTFPKMTRCQGWIGMALSVPATTQAAPNLTAGGTWAMWEGDSASDSVLIKGMATSTGSAFTEYTGILVVSTTGVVILKAATSTPVQVLTVEPGSYVRVFKLN
jgi:hypothetical protein